MDDDQAEHECPRPLATPVDTWNVGDQFFSPAGRWETIMRFGGDQQRYAMSWNVYTDRTGPDYAWTLRCSEKYPNISAYDIGAYKERHVAVCDSRGRLMIYAVITSDLYDRWNLPKGHELVWAAQVKGEGWRVSDRPFGPDTEHVMVADKAKARTEVTRRAKAHAKALGLKVYRRPEVKP